MDFGTTDVKRASRMLYCWRPPLRGWKRLVGWAMTCVPMGNEDFRFAWDCVSCLFVYLGCIFLEYVVWFLNFDDK